MNSSNASRLDEATTLLAEYGDRFRKAIAANSQADDPRAQMIPGGFQFGLVTTEAVKVLLATHDSFAPHAATVCRAFYELSIRLLWAVRAANGWRRLQVYYATEDIKWAKQAQGIAPTASLAAEVLRTRQEVLDRTLSDGSRPTVSPSLEVMLKDIEDHDIAMGLRCAGGQAASVDYAYVYRMLCRPAHGHMSVVLSDKPEGLMLHATTVPLTAALSMVQTSCHAVERDPKREIEAVVQRALRILTPPPASP